MRGPSGCSFLVLGAFTYIKLGCSDHHISLSMWADTEVSWHQMALLVNQGQGEKVKRSPGDRQWKGEETEEPGDHDQGGRSKNINRHQ